MAGAAEPKKPKLEPSVSPSHKPGTPEHRSEKKERDKDRESHKHKDKVGYPLFRACYRPQMKLREGNVFTSVCHSVHGTEGAGVGRYLFTPALPGARPARGPNNLTPVKSN